MLIVRVERKRGDSKYVKAGIRRSSGGSIRLQQADIQEHTRKGEMYVLEDQGTVEGCLLISINDSKLSINIISISPHCITPSVCEMIIGYAKSLSHQAEEILVTVPRNNYLVAILLRDRGLVVRSTTPDWVILHGLFPLREMNNHISVPSANIRHQPSQISQWSPRGRRIVLPSSHRRSAPQIQEQLGPLPIGQDSLHIFQTPVQFHQYPSLQME